MGRWKKPHLIPLHALDLWKVSVIRTFLEGHILVSKTAVKKKTLYWYERKEASDVNVDNKFKIVEFLNGIL